ncbi:hypothetical protein TRIUR3_29619 [Triticum urartu]|uniref:Uncharacterized protein n=1 Tax=Triticum urartu TaxID=4572 RepID=M8A265_TRIUA|nr:hypothetical protein TRIUR3_29619 [Triticum urartu]
MEAMEERSMAAPLVMVAVTTVEMEIVAAPARSTLHLTNAHSTLRPDVAADGPTVDFKKRKWWHILNNEPFGSAGEVDPTRQHHLLPPLSLAFRQTPYQQYSSTPVVALWTAAHRRVVAAWRAPGPPPSRRCRYSRACVSGGSPEAELRGVVVGDGLRRAMGRRRQEDAGRRRSWMEHGTRRRPPMMHSAVRASSTSAAGGRRWWWMARKASSSALALGRGHGGDAGGLRGEAGRRRLCPPWQAVDGAEARQGELTRVRSEGREEGKGEVARPGGAEELVGGEREVWQVFPHSRGAHEVFAKIPKRERER